jgi:hypothetical protein
MSYLGDAAENRLQVRLIRTSFDLRKHRSSSAAYPPIKRQLKMRTKTKEKKPFLLLTKVNDLSFKISKSKLILKVIWPVKNVLKS